MDLKERRNVRLYTLAVFLVLILLVYLGLLYNTQILNHDAYMAQSIRTIARSETVEASRGIITDRSGRVLVSNRSTYNLTFDSRLLKPNDDPNEAILKLVKLCQANDIAWIDNLPITKAEPFAYDMDSLSKLQSGRFLTYLKSLKSAKTVLSGYLLEHPSIADPDNTLPALSLDDADPDAAAKARIERGNQLVELLSQEQLSAEFLMDAGITPAKLIAWMREDLKLPESFSQLDARLVLGIQYELSIRKLMNTTAYVMAEDISTAFISLLGDGHYNGAKVTSSSAREYETDYAAHILGTVTSLWATDFEDGTLKEKGYNMDDKIGRTGVELAFEDYLRGTDGRRVVSTNADGKITGEFYSEEPQPGNTVELTIDLNLQQSVEDSLQETVSRMTRADGDDTRGAGAVVIRVGTGEVLALASYPTFQLNRYNTDYNALLSSSGKPLNNRATSGLYAPGSTLKPLTATAALESGATTLTEKIRDTGKWTYPGAPSSYTYCWKRSGHGLLNVTGAITNSCNYYFATMGYRMGMDTLVSYLAEFGLGSHTGIEIGDQTGRLPSQNPGEDLAPWAAYGQANQLYTPIQLANYIATLVSGGKHCQAHLLKAVKAYDNSKVIATGSDTPENMVSIQDSTLDAVKKGMLGLTTTGDLRSYFRSCVVSAGAKTGTAQISKNVKNNGVFVCFAPYENPEIAVALVIERGGSGAALASTAVNILNAYFTADENESVITGENQLLP